MINPQESNPHKEALSYREGANFLYVTLAQLASSSTHVHIYDIDSDKEDK